MGAYDSQRYLMRLDDYNKATSIVEKNAHADAGWEIVNKWSHAHKTGTTAIDEPLGLAGGQSAPQRPPTHTITEPAASAGGAARPGGAKGASKGEGKKGDGKKGGSKGGGQKGQSPAPPAATAGSTGSGDRSRSNRRVPRGTM
jgi:hypothetical protein